VLARQAAQAAGVKAYLYGTLSVREGAGYVVAVKLLDAASNRELASVEETAAGRGDIAGAIDRVVAGLRVEVGLGGGPGDSAARSDVPLAREATGSVEALHAYSVGVAAMVDGRTGDALKAFQAAVAIDPKFVQAQTRLAWLYRAQHAETASAGAARLAQAASGDASAHTALLAQYSDAVNAAGDLERAGAVIRQFAALYPHDPEGARGVARVLRLQGRFGEALDVGERGIADDPLDGDLYGQAEFSLIALDRYDAALGVEQQAEQRGFHHAGTALTAAYLAGRDGRLESAIERVTRPPYNVSSMAAYGLYLDNTGQLAAGATLWRTAAAGDGWMLAQGALDRGLAGECGVGLEMARAAGAGGMTVSFNVGMTAALCGDKVLAARAIAVLTQDWGGASAVRGYYLPDLRAAVALGARDPQGALDALKGARPYDLVSLTPYLRGLAHVELHENELGVVDFQTVLGHRGVAATGGSDVYPMAQIGLARAYAASGDKANSGRAYRRFLELWRMGDEGERLRMEAEVGGR
jgi:eukaryotic-like serine/threonine-protein kinase